MRDDCLVPGISCDPSARVECGTTSSFLNISVTVQDRDYVVDMQLSYEVVCDLSITATSLSELAGRLAIGIFLITTDETGSTYYQDSFTDQ